MQGELVGIFITEKKSQTMSSVMRALAVANAGIEGDRYKDGQGTFSKKKKPRDVTLIESESVSALKRDYQIDVEAKDLRRNLLTKNFALNHFVNRRFSIGDVVVEGVELCEPCGYLSKMLELPLADALKHRGGLRCRIVAGGELRVGQKIASLS